MQLTHVNPWFNVTLESKIFRSKITLTNEFRGFRQFDRTPAACGYKNRLELLHEMILHCIALYTWEKEKSPVEKKVSERKITMALYVHAGRLSEKVQVALSRCITHTSVAHLYVKHRPLKLLLGWGP